MSVSSGIRSTRTELSYSVTGITIAEPTKYPPGSAGKLEIMRARYEAGLPIFHPEDNAKARLQWTGLPFFNPQHDVIAAAQAAIAETLKARRAERCS